MNAQFTRDLTRVRNRAGVMEAKRWARARGYHIRWDREGNLYIRDLLSR